MVITENETVCFNINKCEDEEESNIKKKE